MKTRSLGLIFVAAVIVPSILLAVLSIRSAGREEAWMEKQAAATLDAEVAHAASLASGEVGRIQDDLRAGLDVPAGADYAQILTRWKQSTPLVAVPFLLSPRYGILWPPPGGAGSEQRQFLKDNGDFLSDRAATTVLQNIAVRYQAEILGQAENAPARAPVPAQPAPGYGAMRAGSGGVAAAVPPQAQASSREQQSAEAPSPSEPEASTASSSGPSAPADEKQMAIDTFAQSPAVQTRVYEEARQKGDQLSARNVAPKVLAAPAGSDAAGAQGSSGAEAAAAPAQEADKDLIPPAPAPQPESAPRRAAALKKEAAVSAQPSPPSQFVRTSQLLSQIASRGEYGIIPRFTGERLEFLFWERQRDGRIAGCEIADAAFRSRIAGVLESTWTPVRVLTLLDENGSPLLTPPGSEGQDWRRPFVAREVGESLPRWEAAAYLTQPDSISSRARSSSLVIWILVMILFVSVAGGGTMVLSSVYAGMKTAQQKATFVTNVSHELKTPLTSISLFVDLLRRKGPLAPAKREQYLSLMASETERLTRLINNVLDFSRDRESRRYSMRTVDAAEVAAQIVESQRVRLEAKGFRLSLEVVGAGAGGSGVDQPGLQVCADPEALKQVLLNLLSNAEKYSRDTRDIAVELTGDPAEVAIAVSDRGIGIPEKEREKIFREFYRVDDSLSSGVQGTGLGLSIARRIARDHGGDITCTARPGGGSRFVVRLPAGRKETNE